VLFCRRSSHAAIPGFLIIVTNNYVARQFQVKLFSNRFSELLFSSVYGQTDIATLRDALRIQNAPKCLVKINQDTRRINADQTAFGKGHGPNILKYEFDIQRTVHRDIFLK
jgi:hypothetical protein